MANTVKAYKNYNGQVIIDCGTHYGKPVQYVISDIGVVQVSGPLVVTDFTGMEEQYFDNMILATLDNAMIYGTNGRKLTNDEITQLIVLANEKIEDFDGPE
jgi:ethanolamine utilization protein EutA (predicted chaperonin)